MDIGHLGRDVWGGRCCEEGRRASVTGESGGVGELSVSTKGLLGSPAPLGAARLLSGQEGEGTLGEVFRGAGWCTDPENHLSGGQRERERLSDGRRADNTGM